jgi:hypothetical protein
MKLQPTIDQFSVAVDNVLSFNNRAGQLWTPWPSRPQSVVNFSAIGFGTLLHGIAAEIHI